MAQVTAKKQQHDIIDKYEVITSGNQNISNNMYDDDDHTL